MTIPNRGIPSILLSIAIMLVSPTTSASVNFDEDLTNDPYHIGKVIYHRKLACPNCPLSKTTIDVSMYKTIVARLNTDKQLVKALNDKEREAVTYYLEQLFTPR